MSGDLITQDEIGLDRLQRAPAIDRIDARQLALIKATLAISENAADPITNAEIGHYLELCAAYGLDPFAREAWIAKSKTGKLLIMVGRAGLRKIVQRNGHKMNSQVVHTKDTFTVEYVDGPDDAKSAEEWAAWGSAPFHRVTHKHDGIGPETRGPVSGAWARVRDPKTGTELGFFTAPLSEYMPSNVSSYSPWSKQVSAMMRGAVERQAAAEATPLGGLLAEGEDESANASATVGAGAASAVTVDLPSDVESVIVRGQQVGHERYGNRARVAMEIGGQSVEATAAYVRAAWAELGSDEPPETITDADVVADEMPSLTFGGQTFTFNDTDDPYASIMAALNESTPGAAYDEAVAMMAMAVSIREHPEGTDEQAEWYEHMAAAMRQHAAMLAESVDA